MSDNHDQLYTLRCMNLTYILCCSQMVVAESMGDEARDPQFKIMFTNANFRVFAVIAGFAKRMSEIDNAVRGAIAKLDLKAMVKAMSTSKVSIIIQISALKFLPNH